VKLAGHDDPVRWCPGSPGSRRLRPAVEREPIVVRGTRPPRASVGVGETGGDKAQRVRRRALVDDHRGARRPREGFAIPVRGRL
jgi:hypothetical protein